MSRGYANSMHRNGNEISMTFVKLQIPSKVETNVHWNRKIEISNDAFSKPPSINWKPESAVLIWTHTRRFLLSGTVKRQHERPSSESNLLPLLLFHRRNHPRSSEDEVKGFVDHLISSTIAS